MGQRTESLATGVLVLAAVTIAVVLVHREFFGRRGPSLPQATVTYIKEWRALLPVGRLVGDSNAAVKIIEFADLQCPYCRRFNRSVHLAMQEFPGQVALVYVHLPLKGHEFALPAARAVECAHPQGRFSELVDTLYERQDDLEGSDPDDLSMWTGYAAEAGIVDTTRFRTCMRDSTPPPFVTAGLDAAIAHSITATPTVILNGWKYSVPPSDSVLLKRIRDLLDGKSPQTFLSKLLRR